MLALLKSHLLLSIVLCIHSAVLAIAGPPGKSCVLRPPGPGHDDTDQVEAAIARCGQFGTMTFEPGNFNITRKMTWNLVSSKVDLKGFLNFPPDIQFWLNAANTYRVVFIQSQASWFVVTGSDFVIDAHNTGGIQGNGQPWWSYFATRTREDGDGRPIYLTVVNATTLLFSPVILLWMVLIQSNKISLLNWDVTCGDDCLAIKGNSSNLSIRNITCRGGTGIAFGSLGQYVGLLFRLDPSIQPLMENGVYFKSWDGSVNGAPPTGGGGAGGLVKNVVIRNVQLDRVDNAVHLYQTNLGLSNWVGTADTNTIVNFQCSPAVGCGTITFSDLHVSPPLEQVSQFICANTTTVIGLPAPCNAAGEA
ncbi:pectin lyase fold/virulence factor [Gymnopilus junonius]|uniref:galacturonan 1,4-alpha-galacturonidase n=1 Tax=Gymnopilus junonius TaxID=109634 RepID=A0A9P5TRJ2_GYMJU|nr:pectin lyase fold/virulence factor [Gymnopilus junonius]